MYVVCVLGPIRQFIDAWRQHEFSSSYSQAGQWVFLLQKLVVFFKILIQFRLIL